MNIGAEAWPQGARVLRASAGEGEADREPCDQSARLRALLALGSRASRRRSASVRSLTSRHGSGRSERFAKKRPSRMAQDRSG